MIRWRQSTTSHGFIATCPAKPIHLAYSHRISAYVMRARIHLKNGTSQINSSFSVAMNRRKMLRRNAIDGFTINTMTKLSFRSGRSPVRIISGSLRSSGRVILLALSLDRRLLEFWPISTTCSIRNYRKITKLTLDVFSY